MAAIATGRQTGKRRVMTLVSQFLGFRGRIGRAQWWLRMLVVVAAIAAMLAIAFLSSQPLLAIPFILFVFVSVYALAVKRLHDRNKSGGWALVFIFIPGVLDRVTDRLTEDTPLWWVLVLIGSVLTIWGLIELGFRRGTDGDNEYGPDPLAPSGPVAKPEAVGR
jgi:uncharacterized membrane protein YhaH (DUF805 family)